MAVECAASPPLLLDAAGCRPANREPPEPSCIIYRTDQLNFRLTTGNIYTELMNLSIHQILESEWNFQFSLFVVTQTSCVYIRRFQQNDFSESDAEFTWCKTTQVNAVYHGSTL